MGAKLSVGLEVISNATKELNSIGREFNTFQNRIVAMGRAITGVFIGGAATSAGYGEIKKIINVGIEYGDTMAAMAERTGLAVEEVQRLDFIAMKSNTTLEQMQKPLKALAINVFENENAFKILGVSVRGSSGEYRQLGEIFKDTIFRISDIKNTTERAALTSKFFGKQSLEVAAIIGKGKDAIKGYYDEAEKLGIILNKETINALDDAKDSVELSERAWKSASAQLAITFTPAMVEFSKWTATAAKALRDFGEPKQFDMLAETLKKFENFKADKAIQISVGDKKTMAEFKAYEMQIKAYTKMKEDAEKASNASSGFTNDQFDTKKAEQEAKKHKRFLLQYEKEYGDESIELISAIGIRKLEIEEKQALAEIEFMDQTEEEKEMLVVGVTRRFDALKLQMKREQNNKIRDLDLERLQAEEDREKRLQQGHLNFIIARQKAYEEYNRNLKYGSIESASTALSALNTIGQASKANAQVMRKIAQGQAIASGALAAIRALENPVPLLRWLDFSATLGATAGQVALIEQQQFWRGTGGSMEGQALVGEHGPELINMPRGSVIHTASETRNLTTNNNGGNVVNVHIHGQNGDIIDTFNASMRRGTGNVDQFFDLVIQGIKQRG
jgi:hypothetical protein